MSKQDQLKEALIKAAASAEFLEKELMAAHLLMVELHNYHAKSIFRCIKNVRTIKHELAINTPIK